jgi:hypothetical protein
LNLFISSSFCDYKKKDFIHCPPGPLGKKCHEEGENTTSSGNSNSSNSNGSSSSYYGNSNTGTTTNTHYYSNSIYTNEDQNDDYFTRSSTHSTSETPNFASSKPSSNYLTWIYVATGLVLASSMIAFIAYKSVSFES